MSSSRFLALASSSSSSSTLAKSSSLSISSTFKAKEFNNLVITKAIPYTNTEKPIRFKYKTKDSKDATRIPDFYLELDTEYIYFNVSDEGWIYIYIPEILSNGDVSYIEYESNGLKYYKGNHVSISYDRHCDIIIFHYTEYDDSYENKTYEFCNFKIEDFTDDMKCINCKNGKIEQQTRRQTFKNNPDKNDEVSRKKYSYISNIIYKIIQLLKETTKATKIIAKEEQIKLRKREAEKKQRNEKAKTESAMARNERVKQELAAATAASSAATSQNTVAKKQAKKESKEAKELRKQSEKEAIKLAEKLRRDAIKAAEREAEAIERANAERNASLLAAKVKREEEAALEAAQEAEKLKKEHNARLESASKLTELLAKKAAEKAEKEAKKLERATKKAAEKAAKKGGRKKNTNTKKL